MADGPPVVWAEVIARDYWTLPVLRELFMGSYWSDEIQAQARATP